MAFVIVDTSSILYGLAYGKDVFEAVARDFHGRKQVISRGVIRELLKISKNRGKKGSDARAALSVIRYKNLDVDNSNNSVDSWILGKSLEHPNTVVITNDTELHKRLKAEGVLALKLTKAGVLK